MDLAQPGLLLTTSDITGFMMTLEREERDLLAFSCPDGALFGKTRGLARADNKAWWRGKALQCSLLLQTDVRWREGAERPQMVTECIGYTGCTGCMYLVPANYC